MTQDLSAIRTEHGGAFTPFSFQTDVLVESNWVGTGQYFFRVLQRGASKYCSATYTSEMNPEYL